MKIQDLKIQIDITKQSIERAVKIVKYFDENLVETRASLQSLSGELRALEFQRYLHTPCYKFRVNG